MAKDVLVISEILSNRKTHSKVLNKYYSMMRDGIEHQEVRDTIIEFKLYKKDKKSYKLRLSNWITNLIVWIPFIKMDVNLTPYHILDCTNITKYQIEEYLNQTLIIPYRKQITNVRMNELCATVIEELKRIWEDFSMILGINLNIKSDIDMMNECPEYKDIIETKFDRSMAPREIHEALEERTTRIVELIKGNPNHSLYHILNSGQGVNPKQLAENHIAIGTKPDGTGSIFPIPISDNYLDSGLTSASSYFIESVASRNAQIINKTQTGATGYFGRKLSTLTQHSKLHRDPNYDCGSIHYIEVDVLSETHLKLLDKKYYKKSPNGPEMLLNYTYGRDLIGRTIWLRTAMCCASASRGEGICYRCYGDLAYTNNDIHIGGIASKEVSARFTQTNLSAKHLNASNVKKNDWTTGTDQFFDIEFEYIIPAPEAIVNNYLTIRIDQDDIKSDSDDEVGSNYSEFIEKFYIYNKKTKEEWEITTDNATHLYFHESFKDEVEKKRTALNDIIEIPMHKLEEDQPIFVMNIENDAISTTFRNIKRTIDYADTTCNHTKETLIASFMELLLQGGIKIASVHIEVILANMMRDVTDVLQYVDWSVDTPQYRIYTITSANINDPSILTSLSFQEVGSQLVKPLSYRKSALSTNDIYFRAKGIE